MVVKHMVETVYDLGEGEKPPPMELQRNNKQEKRAPWRRWILNWKQGAVTLEGFNPALFRWVTGLFYRVLCSTCTGFTYQQRAVPGSSRLTVTCGQWTPATNMFQFRLASSRSFQGRVQSYRTGLEVRLELYQAMCLLAPM